MDPNKDGKITKEEFIYFYLNKLERLYSQKIQIEDDINFNQVREKHLKNQGKTTTKHESNRGRAAANAKYLNVTVVEA